MRIYLTYCILMLSGIVQLSSSRPDVLYIKSVYCENKAEAFGVSTTNIRFSWKIISPDRNVKQRAYRICLADVERDLDAEKSLLWDSGIIKSGQSILVKYDGPALESGTSYYFKIKVWDNHGNESGWSQNSRFITGLSAASDWAGARWIAYDELDQAKRIVPGIHAPDRQKEWRDLDSGNHVLPLIRKEFTVRKNLKQALIFISGLGHYELQINGRKTGANFLSPGWTDYDTYAFYNTFDVTEELGPGRNAVGVMLGNGFFIIPNNGYRKLITAFGNPMMILKMELRYDDGDSDTIVSNEQWKTAGSPITYASIFAGETYDARQEHTNWSTPAFDDSQWRNVITLNEGGRQLRSELDYPLKICEKIEVRKIKTLNREAGRFLYDFGQNASGIIELEVHGSAGDSIRLKPAELINSKFEAEQSASGKPYALIYICKGDGIEVWQPRFTYYGFRYVEVSGAVPDTISVGGHLPRIVALNLLHTRNSAPEQGHFESSDGLFNRINQLIRWAIRSNLQSVVTDCPHREKLGWLEQTYLMGEGIHFNYDVYHLYKKLIDDMITAQTADGLVPDIAPEYTEFEGGFRDSPEWGSAAVILPWLVYKWYGDKEPMQKAWHMMIRYVEYLGRKADRHILSHGLGDWYDLGPNPPGTAQLTPKALTATAIYYYDVHLLSRMAGILNKEKDFQRFSLWAEDIKKAFNEQFFDRNTNTYATGSQTSMAMPLVTGLVPEGLSKNVENALINSINESGKSLTAGDVGFHFLVRALYEAGADDLLFEMNARDDVPGYGYQLKKGATALTESWAALEYVSNNHLMLGHLMEWFYAGLGGISQSDSTDAYRDIILHPRVIDTMDSARASFESPYGRISSQWVKNEESITFNFEIPANTSATIVLPVRSGQTLLENDQAVRGSDDIKFENMPDNSARLRVGSGRYRFTISNSD